MFSANSEAESEKEGGVKNQKYDLVVLQCAANNCSRERGSRVESSFTDHWSALRVSTYYKVILMFLLFT